ncbi:MAG: hypothetical protein V3W04_05685 [Gammaproteobacteria bacterium]
MDNILILSIFLVFITALAGSFFQHRKRDRVLTEFQGYQIILQLQEDQKVWGRMDVFPNGLELHYARPYKNLIPDAGCAPEKNHHTGGWRHGEFL